MIHTSNERWRTLALILAAHDDAVDLESIEAEPDYTDQAIARYGAEARRMVAAHEFLDLGVIPR